MCSYSISNAKTQAICLSKIPQILNYYCISLFLQGAIESERSNKQLTQQQTVLFHQVRGSKQISTLLLQILLCALVGQLALVMRIIVLFIISSLQSVQNKKIWLHHADTDNRLYSAEGRYFSLKCQRLPFYCFILGFYFSYYFQEEVIAQNAKIYDRNEQQVQLNLHMLCML